MKSRLALLERLFLVSTATACNAALKAIRAGLRGNVVTLYPDRGDRYISKGLFGVEK